mmetsp:Transcript_29485/g.85302  ORF Transcript_29485/g.85302 Transcript_29485/m.85302 type:complete len:363 (+) Transcript_29485:1392-2480(+)
MVRAHPHKILNEVPPISIVHLHTTSQHPQLQSFRVDVPRRQDREQDLPRPGIVAPGPPPEQSTPATPLGEVRWCAVVVVDGDGVDLVQQVAVCEHDALGNARRARRVHDGRDVLRRDRGRVEGGGPCVGELVELIGRRHSSHEIPTPLQHHNELEPFQSAPRPQPPQQRLGVLRGLRHQTHAVRMLKHVLLLIGRRRQAAWDRGSPSLHDGLAGDQPSMGVLGQQHDFIAFIEPQLLQRAGEVVDHVTRLCEREVGGRLMVGVDEQRPLAVLGGQHLPQLWHGREKGQCGVLRQLIRVILWPFSIQHMIQHRLTRKCRGMVRSTHTRRAEQTLQCSSPLQLIRSPRGRRSGRGDGGGAEGGR